MTDHPLETRGWYYYGWNIVAAMVLLRVVANGLTSNSFTLFLKDWSDEFNTPVSSLQLATGIMLCVSSLISPIIGSLGDRYSARLLFGGGLAGMTLFFLTMSLVTSSTQILLLYGIVAAPSLVLLTGAVGGPLITRWFSHRLGLALGLASFGISLAGVFLPPIIGLLLPTIGWRAIWLGAALITGLIIGPIALLIIRDKPTSREGLHYIKDGAGGSSLHTRDPVNASAIIDLGRSKKFWVLVGIYLPMLIGSMGVAGNLGPYAAHYGLDRQTAGLLVTVLSAMHVMAALVLGIITDRLGVRIPLLALAALVTVGLILLATGPGLVLIVVGVALVGLAGGLLAVLPAVIALEFGPQVVGRVFGMCMVFIPVAAFSPFFVAKVQEFLGDYSIALSIMASMVSISGVFSYFMRGRQKDGRQSQAERSA